MQSLSHPADADQLNIIRPSNGSVVDQRKLSVGSRKTGHLEGRGFHGDSSLVGEGLLPFATTGGDAGSVFSELLTDIFLNLLLCDPVVNVIRIEVRSSHSSHVRTLQITLTLFTVACFRHDCGLVTGSDDGGHVAQTASRVSVDEVAFLASGCGPLSKHLVRFSNGFHNSVAPFLTSLHPCFDSSFHSSRGVSQ